MEDTRDKNSGRLHADIGPDHKRALEIMAQGRPATARQGITGVLFDMMEATPEFMRALKRARKERA